MNTPQQNNGAPDPGPFYPPGPTGNPPPQEPPFIPYQKPTPPPPPPYYGQPGGYPPHPGKIMPPYAKPKTRMATASLVLGSICLGLVLIGFLGDLSDLAESVFHNSSNFVDLTFPVVVCGLLALIFGLVSRSRFRNYPPDFPARRNSLLGIIFASIGLGIYVLIYLLALSFIAYLFILFLLSI